LTNLIDQHSFASGLSERVEYDGSRNSYKEKYVENNEYYKKSITPLRPTYSHMLIIRIRIVG